MRSQSLAKLFVEANKDKTFQYEPLPNDQNPGHLSNWILKDCRAHWLNILIDAPYAEMLEEARSLKDHFVQHRDDQSEGWRSLTVHGVASHITNVPEMHGLNSNEVTYQWTEIAHLCPVTVDYFKNIFPYREYHRLRFMLVEPQGYIMPHSDNQSTFLGAAVNISLNNPAGCRLVTTGGAVPFKDTGSAFLFNNHYDHAVYNDSNEDRFHIIVHGVWTSKWEELVVRSYRAALESTTEI